MKWNILFQEKASDKENLESVLTKIFLIRLALNYVYLLGDSGKQAEAESLAAAIALLLLMPEGTEVIKTAYFVCLGSGRKHCGYPRLAEREKDGSY